LDIHADRYDDEGRWYAHGDVHIRRSDAERERSAHGRVDRIPTLRGVAELLTDLLRAA